MFLLPPKAPVNNENSVTTKEYYHARRRIWTGNALAVFLVLILVACACVYSILFVGPTLTTIAARLCRIYAAIATMSHPPSY